MGLFRLLTPVNDWRLLLNALGVFWTPPFRARGVLAGPRATAKMHPPINMKDQTMKALVSACGPSPRALLSLAAIFLIAVVAHSVGAVLLGLWLMTFAPQVAGLLASARVALRSPIARTCLAAIGALALVVVAGAALAADAAAPAGTTVSLPWGDALAGLLATTASIVAAVLSWVVGRFAPAIIKTVLTNDVIAKGVDYALGAVEGAVRGKTADVRLSNTIVAAAANYIAGNYPTIAKWIGDNLQPLIIARLSALGVLPAEASAATLGQPAA